MNIEKMFQTRLLIIHHFQDALDLLNKPDLDQASTAVISSLQLVQVTTETPSIKVLEDL